MAVGLVAAIPVGACLNAQTNLQVGRRSMERVDGIGGFFFRAKDPTSLANWYEENLGVSLVPGSYDAKPWQTAAGPTVFAPFEETTTYFGDERRHWMINFRVRDLNAMITQLLRAA